MLVTCITFLALAMVNIVVGRSSDSFAVVTDAPYVATVLFDTENANFAPYPQNAPLNSKHNPKKAQKGFELFGMGVVIHQRFVMGIIPSHYKLEEHPEWFKIVLGTTRFTTKRAHNVKRIALWQDDNAKAMIDTAIFELEDGVEFTDKIQPVNEIIDSIHKDLRLDG